MNIDLVKAYDRVDWIFLRFLLLQIVLSLHVIEWIVACVMSSQYYVLIIGSPTDFFKGSRGIGQDCPLSPLLFLLGVEGLIHMISGAKMDG